ncbi:MAG: TrmH family RNA methyltransferase [Clostridia bacterium]|nr:TrmH family RNA methyltransferase [Clostridia bacterium]
MGSLKKYRKEDAYSYTLGSFPTYELINASPERCERVLYDPGFTGKDDLIREAAKRGIPSFEDPKSIARISDKGNVRAVGVFRKGEPETLSSRCHAVLVNPSDMGNVGTILRTAAGFGGVDVALIAPCADLYDPKTVRASMGALFRVRAAVFPSFEEYAAAYPERLFYPFMLEGSESLRDAEKPEGDFSLVFGNEASGHPDSFRTIGKTVRIPMTPAVDSYNLAVSVAIGLYAFLF